jgi:type VI secretion system secreted protein VgrG
MPTFTGAERFLFVDSKLGTDKLILSSFSGHEGISQLFSFHLEFVSEDPHITPDQVLGQKIAFGLSAFDAGKKQPFNGIVIRWWQLGMEGRLMQYRAEVAPQFWLLTRRSQSRIFQHKPVPDILKTVLSGLDVSFELQGTFEPRKYCVQYRETDFQFASRLMEEEGIFYFFKHLPDAHRMVIANTPGSHSDIPENACLEYEDIGGGGREDERVTGWEKMQELRSGKYTLWDHTFELPHKHLEANQITQASVAVGQVDHKLRIGNFEALEIYDYPGGYAKRFDGVDRGGGASDGDLQKIFQDNKRTVQIREQEESCPAIQIYGLSNCRHLVSGHKFSLQNHPDADGAYVLTTVSHTAREGSIYSGMGGDHIGAEESHYSNTFTALPLALTFRPQRTTPKPLVRGCQTAVVVGPAGEEIFADKYGRVKVQFHWDREGKNDAASSCWLRVATHWAGKQWGAIHIPRIGQEVIVDFLEGDPDQPIIVGSVYNAEMMPPYALPDNKTMSGIKTRSSMRGTSANFNEIRFEDKKGDEELYIHAEKNKTVVVENDRDETVGHDETIAIGNDREESVGRDESITIGNNRSESVGANESITIGNNRTLNVGKNEEIVIGANESLSVAANRTSAIGKDDTLDVGKKLHVTVGDEILLKTGSASITMKKDGTITIKGKDITIDGSGKINIKAGGNVTVKGSKILQN